MHRRVMLLAFALVLSSCFVAVAYAYDYKLVPSPSTEVPKNVPVTMTFTTDDTSVTTVTFRWYDPDGNLAYTDGPKSLSSGTASSTYPPDAVGNWLVEATANNGAGRQRGFAVQDLIVNVVPELPVLGTLGAAGAMMAGFVYKSKRQLKR